MNQDVLLKNYELVSDFWVPVELFLLNFISVMGCQVKNPNATGTSQLFPEQLFLFSLSSSISTFVNIKDIII